MDSAAMVMEEATALYNKGDAEGFCSLYASDVVLTTPDGRFEGRAAALAYVQGLMSPWPGAVVTIGRHYEEGGTYFGEFTLRGTNDGPLALPDGTELPPTHKTVELIGMEIGRVEDGKVTQHDMVWDNMAIMAQLDLLPPS